MEKELNSNKYILNLFRTHIKQLEKKNKLLLKIILKFLIKHMNVIMIL